MYFRNWGGRNHVNRSVAKLVGFRQPELDLDNLGQPGLDLDNQRQFSQNGLILENNLDINTL